MKITVGDPDPRSYILFCNTQRIDELSLDVIGPEPGEGSTEAYERYYKWYEEEFM